MLLLLAAAAVARAAPVITLPGFGRLTGTIHNTTIPGPAGGVVSVASFRGIPFAVFRRWDAAAEARSVRAGLPHLEPVDEENEENVNARSFGPGCNIAAGAGLVPSEGDEEEECLSERQRRGGKRARQRGRRRGAPVHCSSCRPAPVDPRSD